MSELLALGVSHKTAPLDLRERLSLTEGRAVGALRRADRRRAGSTRRRRSRPATGPSSTWSSPTRSRPSRPRSASSPARRRSARPSCSATSTRCAPARPPATCFQVTAGLDSMILGEAEIQGQVKRAYELALVEGATGPILNRLFRGALAAGGRAREETGISEKGVSIPSVAVELARRTLGDLSEQARARRRRRRDRRAGRPGAGRPRRRHRLRRQPPLRPRDRPRPALRRHRGPLRRAARAADRRRHRRLGDQLAAPHRRARRARAGDGGAAGAAAAADRPRGAARHRAGLPRDRRRQPPRHRRRPADRRTQRRAAARPRRGGRSRSSTPSSTASSAGSPRSRWCRRSPPCASAATRSCAGSWPRTRAAGRASARPTASGWRRWRRRSPPASCTSRPCGCSRSAGSDDAYLYVSALRELFGLDVETEPEGEEPRRQRHRAAPQVSRGAERCGSPPAAVRWR